jgi:predicted nucleotidyltransferase
MSVPVQSVRVRPEHRDILQAVARLLRLGYADTLRRLVNDIRVRPVGPFKSEAAAIAFLRDRLVATLRPKMIWLFGSRALGEGRDDSDFDLLVVLPDGLEQSAYDYQSVAAPLVACGLAYDVVPCRWSEFEALKDAERGIIACAVREGRLLYTDRSLRAAQAAA